MEMHGQALASSFALSGVRTGPAFKLCDCILLEDVGACASGSWGNVGLLPTSGG
jgi:hypothetical protein